MTSNDQEKSRIEQLEDEDRLGDALFGLLPDPDGDAVEAVREIRRREYDDEE